MATNDIDALIDKRPRIGITIGDAAGIGPEIVLKSLSKGNLDQQKVRPVIIGDGKLVRMTADAVGSDIEFKNFGADGPSDAIEIVDLANLKAEVTPGQE